MNRTRVLVVEDNEINLKLVRALLEHAGYEVISAEGVVDGRARLEEVVPQLVLMDIQVPGGGGLVLLEEIRADPRLARLPVVALTAYAMEGDRERFLAAGFDGYMSKPIDVRGFLATVASFLGVRDAAPETER